MLFKEIDEIKRIQYVKNISNVARLSVLFASELSAPYLAPRAAENIFCNTLGARNIGRDDSAIDAILGTVGIGIKTFLHGNGNTLQKIAEFNKDSVLYRNLPPMEIILFISRLRNARLQFAMDNYNVEGLIYHCITRKNDGIINFYETSMDFIDISNISNIVVKQNSIFFDDKKNEYSFNMAKSTLFERFVFIDETHIVESVHIEIVSEPYLILDRALSLSFTNDAFQTIEHPYVILPLYSTRNKKKFIPEKSGLNQWNAGGRKRNKDEIYIPIASKIHRAFPDFFPPRDIKFNLRLPNLKNINVKVCQDNCKALMSNPNKDLGEWLLRDVLRVDDGTVLKYETLEEMGIDAVQITKLSNTDFEIEFLELGSYEEFSLLNNL